MPKYRKIIRLYVENFSKSRIKVCFINTKK